MADFRKLEVFDKAHALALTVIRASAEMRGPIAQLIKTQMVRAALSVPTNVVEGSAKDSDRDYARYVSISIGSSSELEYHLLVARDSGLMSEMTFQSLLDQLIDVRKMLTGLRRRLKASADAAGSKAGSRSAGSR
jgi:four helix bundle protein